MDEINTFPSILTFPFVLLILANPLVEPVGLRIMLPFIVILSLIEAPPLLIVKSPEDVIAPELIV